MTVYLFIIVLLLCSSFLLYVLDCRLTEVSKVIICFVQNSVFIFVLGMRSRRTAECRAYAFDDFRCCTLLEF